MFGDYREIASYQLYDGETMLPIDKMLSFDIDITHTQKQAIVPRRYHPDI